ncbi:RBBP9/YdeN family alpha/beta hydrolase [Nakamurella endophytica]|uniref:Serine hydrolase family protein n=1 Tax=Nakamurella endophytica TaxID=1748367 RepID=A0A917T8X1_9ACTN|nr:alpha/beta hydrolase [Nakamurella endophytica]GGM14804.1 hypothetical protein GCM10011594_38490 [Nakamurella endophytica]
MSDPETPPPRRAVVVHGYQAAPDRHWFPWLARELGAQGIAVTVVALPDSDHPDVRSWSEAVAAAVGRVDAGTWLIGHSLGCVTVLRHLGGLAGPWSAAGVVLVAGFAEPLASVPELASFLAEPLAPDACRRIADRVPVRRMIRSDADVFVPADASDRLAAAIGAPVTVVPGAGHFMGSDGVTEFPLVRDLVSGRERSL